MRTHPRLFPLGTSTPQTSSPPKFVTHAHSRVVAGGKGAPLGATRGADAQPAVARSVATITKMGICFIMDSSFLVVNSTPAAAASERLCVKVIEVRDGVGLRPHADAARFSKGRVVSVQDPLSVPVHLDVVTLDRKSVV